MNPAHIGRRHAFASRTPSRRLAPLPRVPLIVRSDAGRTSRSWIVGSGAGILCVFLALRLLLLWRFPPFYDEALYAHWTVDGFEDPALRTVSMRTADEPLFTWLGMMMMWLGAGPLTAIRLGSTIAGLFTMVICGLIGHELGGRTVGLAASGLAAILPFFVVHDVIGITDPLATTIMAAVLYTQIRLARSPSLGGALMLGLLLGAGFLTKPTTYVAIALLPVSLLVFPWRAAGTLSRLARWAGGVVVAVAIAYAMYSIMKISPYWEDFVRYRGQHGAAAGQSAHSIAIGLSHPLRWIRFNWHGYQEALHGYLTIPVLVAALVGAVIGVKRKRALTGIVLAWSLAPLVVALLLTETQYPRYILVGIPPVVALAAYGVSTVVSELLRRPGRAAIAIVAAVTVAFVAPALVFVGRVQADPTTFRYPGLDDGQYVTGGAALAPYDRVIRDLREKASRGQVVVALGDFTSDYFALRFRSDTSVGLIRIDAPSTCGALLAVETMVPLPARPLPMAWRPLTTYERPRNGIPTVVYESGVVAAGRLNTSPDMLREAIGGSDADFDAFTVSQPCVKEWLTAWYEANPTA